jgi:hypothetical protein
MEEQTIGQCEEKVALFPPINVSADELQGRAGLPEVAKAARENGGERRDARRKQRKDRDEQGVGEIGEAIDWVVARKLGNDWRGRHGNWRLVLGLGGKEKRRHSEAMFLNAALKETIKKYFHNFWTYI